MATPPVPSVAGEVSAAGGRLLGTQPAQEAVDDLAGAARSLAATLKGAVSAVAGLAKSGGAMWTGSPSGMAYGKPNGGGSTFGSGIFAKTLLGGGPTMGSTQTMGAGRTNGGGDDTASQAGAVFGGGLAGSFWGMNALARRNTPDYVTMDYLGQRFGNPAGMDRRTAVQSLFSNRPYGWSTTDLGQAQASMMSLGQAPNSMGWNQSQASLQSMAITNRDMSASSIAQSMVGLASSRSYYSLARFGLQTLSPGGAATPTPQLASRVASLTGINMGTKMSTAQLLATFDNQNSMLNLNLQNMGLDDNTQQAIRGYLRNKAVAGQNGMSGTAFDSALAKGDLGALRKAGVDDTALGSMQQRSGVQRNNEAAIASDFAAGLSNANDQLNKFTSAMTTLLNSPFGRLAGTGMGASSMVTGAIQGFGNVGGGVMGALGAARIMNGLGGGGSAGGGISGILGGLSSTGLASYFSKARIAGISGGAVAGLLGSAVQDGNGGVRDYVGSALQWGGTGAAIGTMIAPGIGTAIGAGVGALSGLAMQWLGSGRSQSQNTGGGGATGAGGPAGGAQVAGGSGNGKTGTDIVQYAMQFLGRPYVWGASGPNSFDCSGLTSYVYKHAANVSLPRTSAAQAQTGNAVGRNQIAAGDLVFFHYSADRTAGVNHVGIAIGNGQMIEAPATGLTVRVASIDWKHYVSARRYLGAGGSGGAQVDPSVSTNGANAAPSGMRGDAGAVNSGNSEASVIASALGAAGGSMAGSSSVAGNGGTGASSDPSGSGAAGASVSLTPPGVGAESEAQMKAILTAAGFSGQGLDMAMAISRAESGWRPGAQHSNSDSHNSIDKGLFQINSYWHREVSNPFDPTANAAAAFRISNSGTAWNQWSTYTNGAYKQFLKSYDVGAFKIDEDQVAQIHKGEMILDSRQAETVRQALMKDSGRPSTSADGGVTIQFNQGAIVFQVSGAMDGPAAQNAGKIVMDTIAKDNRIKFLQRGK